MEREENYEKQKSKCVWKVKNEVGKMKNSYLTQNNHKKMEEKNPNQLVYQYTVPQYKLKGKNLTNASNKT